MRDRLNCPNCGATINGCTCQYCGTQFFDLADINLNQEGYLRIRIDDRIMTVKAIPVQAELSCDYHNVCITTATGGHILPMYREPSYRLQLEFVTTPGTMVQEKTNG